MGDLNAPAREGCAFARFVWLRWRKMLLGLGGVTKQPALLFVGRSYRLSASGQCNHEYLHQI